jgi:hypothetical protein
MSRTRAALRLVGLAAWTVVAGCGDTTSQPGDEQQPPGAASRLSFFVSSAKSATGNLGGLSGADARCQALAAAVGAGGRTWHAYLSVEHDASNGGRATNARDRIGAGPWYNANGVMVARSVADLHATTLVGNPPEPKHTLVADPTVFVDERGNPVNGQWSGSPSPNEHDILTGSNDDGTLLVNPSAAPALGTCRDWTSASAADGATQVGHSDGLGPARATTPAFYTSWNSAHANQDCSNTAPRGGAGHIYCFAL